MTLDIEGGLRHWNAQAGPERRPSFDQMAPEHWSFDGSRRCSFKISGSPEIRVRSRDGKELLLFREHKSRISDLQISFDGRYAVSVESAGSRFLWDTTTGKILASWRPDPKAVDRKGFGPPARFSEDGRRVAIPAPGGGAEVWEIAEGARRIFVSAAGQRGFLLSPDGRKLAMSPPRERGAGAVAATTIWDVDAASRCCSIEGSRGNLIFSRDAKWVAAFITPEGGWPRFARDAAAQVRVWDASNGSLRRHLKEDVATGALAFSPDGNFLATPARATASSVGDILVWDLNSDAPPRRLKGHAATVTGLAFSPDGKRLASASSPMNSARGEIKLWDPAGGIEMLALEPRGPSDLQQVLWFSPDGARLSRAVNVFAGIHVEVWNAEVRPRSDSIRSGAIRQ
jgi:WD40 repeat protein